MAQRSSTARPAVVALFGGIAVLLVLFTLGIKARALLVVGLLVLAPGFWWRWKTREFRRGIRALRRGEAELSREHFRGFLGAVEHHSGFLRYQPFFNLGRPYDYVAAAHNNLGALALQSGDRVTARREFEAAIGRRTGFAPAYYGRAAVSLLDGDLEDAESAARAGLVFEPRYRPCAILVALCQAERGDRSAAEASLAGLSKPMNWNEAPILWAKMYHLWGEPDRAAKWEAA
ncbi:MAG: hypothetical protein V3U63_10470 [Gemmatimonadota bacterium]